MNQITLCKVEGCRFPHKHTTSGHKCGIKGCKKFGHGQLEHYCPDKLNLLKQFHNETLPHNLRCTIQNCPFPQHHTTDSHQCRFCKRFGHGIDSCIYNNLTNLDDNLLGNISKQEIYEFMNRILTDQNELANLFYIKLNTNIDDILYIKFDKYKHVTTCFITNHWDQYMRNTEDYQLSQNFINQITDYTDEFFKNPYDTKECPICRTQNYINEIDNIFVDAECSICMTNKVELIFGKCKHACICKECLDQI